MRILVCGGRQFKDWRLLFDTLNHEYLIWEVSLKSFPTEKFILIHGDAPGADTLAEVWAASSSQKIIIEVYPADWQMYGVGAGHIRNRKMLDKGKPDLVVAFPGRAGTANMVSIAKTAGVEVREVTG